MTWYNKYVGFPYKHLGDDINKGIDCFNLCRYVYKDHLNIDIPLATYDFCNIVDNDWYIKTTNQLIEDAAKLSTDTFSWEKVDKPKPFDIVLISLGATNITNHCAMIVDSTKILQTMEGRSSWISPYGKYYKQYTTGIYRWNVSQN